MSKVVVPKRRGLRRRTLLRTTAAGLAVRAGNVPWIGARAADTLTINGYGAEFQEVFLSTVVQPFEKKLGVQVTYAAAGMASETYARIRASRESPGFDATVQMTPPEIILGVKENLLEKIQVNEVPNGQYVWEQSKQSMPPYAVVYSYQYLGLLWHTANVDKPSSWLDYWQPGNKYGDKIKGHVVALEPSNLASIYALILGAQCKGGGLENLAPAWDLLRQQKPYVGITVGMSQTAPYFENGQAWLVPSFSARAGYYIQRGLPIGMTVPNEGTIGNDTYAAIPIGAANKPLAKEFINFLLDRETQYNFCLAYQCSPGRPDITGWPAAFAASQIVTP